MKESHSESSQKEIRCFDNQDDEQLKYWFSLLEKTFNTLKKEHCWEEGIVFLNKAILNDVIVSFWYDIHRMICFHNMKKDGANVSKKAAYITKWILKLRPIYFHIDKADDFDAKYTELNENYAFYFSALLCDIDIEKFVKDKRRINEILYTFHYRNTSEETLILLYESLSNENE